MKYALWIVQILLAAVFLMAGSMKLVMPIELFADQTPLPGLFIRFVGLAETLGALGLILPGLLRLRPRLTVLAAIELAHVMVGAVILTLATPEPAGAALPFVVGCLALFVAYGRAHLAPQAAATHRKLVLLPA
ncbi:MAG TPA: DoxX family protein [Chloroflexota bacterium]